MTASRVIFQFILIILFFLLEISLFQIAFPPAISVNLILLVGLSLLFLDYSEESFWWLIGGGVLLDFHSSQVFGVHALTFLAIYLIVNLFYQRVVHQPNLFILTGAMIFSVFCYNLVLWTANSSLSWGIFLKVLGLNLVANFVFLWLAYLFCFYLSYWLEPYGYFSKKDN